MTHFEIFRNSSYLAPMKNCLQCKNEFSPKRERARFCSDICRAKFHQNKKLANKQAEKIVDGLKEVELIEKGEKAAKLFEELLKELGNPILNNKKETQEKKLTKPPADAESKSLTEPKEETKMQRILREKREELLNKKNTK